MTGEPLSKEEEAAAQREFDRQAELQRQRIVREQQEAAQKAAEEGK